MVTKSMLLYTAQVQQNLIRYAPRSHPSSEALICYGLTEDFEVTTQTMKSGFGHLRAAWVQLSFGSFGYDKMYEQA